MPGGQTTKKSWIMRFGLQSDIADKMRDIESSTNQAQKTLNLIKANLKGGWDASRFQEAQNLAKKSVEQTKEKLASLRSEFARISNTPDGIENRAEKLKKVEKEISKTQKAIKEGGEAAKEAQKKLNKLNREQEKLSNSPDGIEDKGYKLKNLGDEIIATENKLRKLNKQLAEVNELNLNRLISSLETAGDRLDKASQKAKYLSAAAAGGLVASAKAAMDYESAFAGVEQMVEGTDEELQKINDDIREMALTTPQSATVLAGIAKDAGQLGVSTPYVTEFTKMVADLVSVTDLSAEEGAANLAKFSNVLQMDEKYYSNLGSTILQLGKSAASAETEIVDMAQKVAATGNLTGMTAPQIMAYSTALSDVGIEADAGGSALSKLLRRMQIAVETGNKDLKKFASAAGMSSKEFVAAFKEDAAGALAQFIQGLQKAEKSGQSATVILNEMGLTETRLSNAILALTSSGDLLTQHLDTANQAWEENTALTETANKKYQTTEAQLQLAKNAVVDMGISLGEGLLPIVTNAASKVQDLAEWFNSLDDSAKRIIVGIGAFTALLSPSLKVTSMFSDVLIHLINGFQKLRPATNGATTAQIALNTAQAASPAGALITAIGALVAIMTAAGGAMWLTSQSTETLSDKINQLKEDYESANKSIEDTKTASEAEVDLVESMIPRYDELNKKTDKTVEEKQELKGIVEKINSLMPDTISALDEETQKYLTQASAIQDVCEKKREKIRLSALEAQALEAQKGILAIENETGFSTKDELTKGWLKSKVQVARDQEQLNSIGWAQAYLMNPEIGKAIDQNKERAEALEEALNSWEQYQKIVDRYTEDKGSKEQIHLDFTGKDKGNSSGETAEEREERLKKQYQKNYRVNEYWYNTEQINTEGYLRNLKAIRDDYLQEGTDDWMSASEKIHSVEKKLYEDAKKAAEEAAKAEKERREKEYDEKRKRLDYEHSVGLVDEQKYLQTLIELQAEYLEQYTDEWYSMAKEIHNLQQSILKAQVEALDEAAKEYKDFADDMIDKAEEEADAKVKAIDDEIAARKKLKEQQQSETELAEARLRLERETDEYNRQQIQKQIEQMEQAAREQKVEDAAEAEKKALEAKIEEMRTMVAGQVAYFNAKLEEQKVAMGVTSETKEPITYQVYNEQYFNSQSLTPAQVESLMQDVMRKMLGGIA